jgi:Putative phage replication protein RstA
VHQLHRSNECLIDYVRFSLSNSSLEAISDLLGIPLTEFTSETRGSPFPTYDSQFTFANIVIHKSNRHDNLLLDLSGQGCRQYEEYMSSVDGWHWQKFLATILKLGGKITRIDLALDIFDESSPSVKQLEKYVKNGQLSSQSRNFREINSGKISDGSLTGFTLYIGANPQLLRIYDKRQERQDQVGEIVAVEKWVRWELELSGQKAIQSVKKIAHGTPLNVVIRGILASHYCFKSKPKKEPNFHNKARWKNMKWWDCFIKAMPEIPLRVIREKPTLSQTKNWLEQSTSKSLAMVHESFRKAYSEEHANLYVQELLLNGKKKLKERDHTLIEQKITELENEEIY